MRIFSKLTIIAIVLLGLLAHSTVSAQEFTEEHLKVARAAVKASGGLSGLDTILPDLADQAKALFIRSNPALTEVIENTTNEAALKLASKRRDLDNKILEIWAARFDIDELKQIEEFYTSPVGQKFYGITPEIAKLSIQEANAWRDALSVELFSLVRDELIAQGYAP